MKNPDLSALERAFTKLAASYLPLGRVEALRAPDTGEIEIRFTLNDSVVPLGTGYNPTIGVIRLHPRLFRADRPQALLSDIDAQLQVWRRDWLESIRWDRTRMDWARILPGEPTPLSIRFGQVSDLLVRGRHKEARDCALDAMVELADELQRLHGETMERGDWEVWSAARCEKCKYRQWIDASSKRPADYNWTLPQGMEPPALVPIDGTPNDRAYFFPSGTARAPSYHGVIRNINNEEPDDEL